MTRKSLLYAMAGLIVLVVHLLAPHSEVMNNVPLGGGPETGSLYDVSSGFIPTTVVKLGSVNFKSSSSTEEVDLSDLELEPIVVTAHRIRKSSLK